MTPKPQTPNPKPQTPTIALIGLRGCGKSTVGRELAALLGGDCVDTDELVAQQAGKSIAAIFAEEGEAGFRRREHDVVAQVVANAPAVISVGGGAVLDQRNVDMLRKVATLVWLTAPAKVLWDRTRLDKLTVVSRPPLTDRAGPAEVESAFGGLAERSALYEQAADLVIDTTDSAPREIASDVATRLGRIGHL